jgi:hypothetical protein
MGVDTAIQCSLAAWLESLPLPDNMTTIPDAAEAGDEDDCEYISKTLLR